MTTAPADDYSGLPCEHVSVNQIVAINMRRWRRAAGLTQEELGNRIGWTGANISAAERSAEPGRDKRRFDADTLVALARALRVPLAAFFLPPDDDGIGKRYLFHPLPDVCEGMSVLVSMLVSDPGDDDPVAYREAYVAAVDGYLDPVRGAELAAHRQGLDTAGQRKAVLERLRWQRDALASLVGDLDQMAESIASKEDDQ